MMSQEAVEFGEWFRRTIAENVTVDTDGWAHELVHRVAARIQEQTGTSFTPVVVWLSEPNAFALPGHCIYLSRALLQLPMPEDAVALAFAHEIAHHELGHVSTMASVPWLRGMPGSSLVSLLKASGMQLLFSAEQEEAADQWALERCLAAGYDRTRCLQLFRALEPVLLDYRNISDVFGPEDEEEQADEALRAYDGDPPPSRLRTFLERSRQWVWRRRGGYPPLRRRYEALRAYESKGLPAKAASQSAAMTGGDGAPRLPPKEQRSIYRYADGGLRIEERLRRKEIELRQRDKEVANLRIEVEILRSMAQRPRGARSQSLVTFVGAGALLGSSASLVLWVLLGATVLIPLAIVFGAMAGGFLWLMESIPPAGSSGGGSDLI